MKSCRSQHLYNDMISQLEIIAQTKQLVLSHDNSREAQFEHFL